MARDVVEVLRESLSLSAKFGNRGRLTLTLDDARAILARLECAERTSTASLPCWPSGRRSVGRYCDEHPYRGDDYDSLMERYQEAVRSCESHRSNAEAAEARLAEERKAHGEQDRQHREDLTALMWHIHQDEKKHKMTVDEALWMYRQYMGRKA